MTSSHILDFLEKHPDIWFTPKTLLQAIEKDIHRTTLFRILKKLENEGKIEKNKTDRETKYRYSQTREQYFDIPYIHRKQVRYTADFLLTYDEKIQPLLSREETTTLFLLNENTLLTTGYLLENKRLLEDTLIDFSFSSSYLEGNTYTYLDTEILLKYGEEAAGKAREEAIMILNHKRALEYMIAQKGEEALTKHILYDIHTLLGQGLLQSEHLGILRKTPVKIGGSAYIPPMNTDELEEGCTLFLEKYNSIENPFEKTIFTICYLPYLQLFYDINKRTSRVLSNMSLLHNNLIPFSFLGVDKKLYIRALLSFYELHDSLPLKNLFMASYKNIAERFV